MLTPFQVVTLMELLEVNAEPYWRCASHLGQLITRFRVALDGRATLTGTTYDQMSGTVIEIHGEVTKMGLRSAVQQIDRIRDYILNYSPTNDGLYQMLVELQTRISDELLLRPFLVMDPSDADFYKKPILFGDDVEKHFPKMSEDISEAGNCIALNRHTAAVFHLMRVMELGVQDFGTKLGVQFAEEKCWQNILDEANKEIKKRDHKLPHTKACAEASAHLYNVKVAWRNEVMHPKQTYTPEEAKKIFDNVKTFICDLVSL